MNELYFGIAMLIGIYRRHLPAGFVNDIKNYLESEGDGSFDRALFSKKIKQTTKELDTPLDLVVYLK